jgi:glutamate synthase domain-containing protein 3
MNLGSRVRNTFEFDLARSNVRQLNQWLHHDLPHMDAAHVKVVNPCGLHNLVVGVNADAQIDICGHAGYYVAGMNKLARITVHGNVGVGVAENIMSGIVHVKGNASNSAAASGCGGLVIIDGNAAARCGISLKGCDIVVRGNIGHASAFMAQTGRLLVCGDAGAGLGESLYEAVIYVGGRIHSLGADAREEPMQESDYQSVAELLTSAGIEHSPEEFKRIASARSLYHWNVEADQDY